MSFIFDARINIFITIYKYGTSIHWLIVKIIKYIKVFIEDFDVFGI
ncbi:hypothetical protein HMPREF1991_02037 [Hoylesella loescheii DSM 19665 = JCM 12249 = ATCC 15930]|uniref:Uncharacterized protein n=1 Tax=Hoylesella loescheii DSM 19665 = JCM 12249 = ATCC 15930 TaxID=1122985 RepID=A0A069QIJ6_HOYLO|nr:hypothetical protein HMPREF1991_02037 [Hoylesella loescheii DSM 19665 = JCM 12249 = ATCC 15930]